MDTEYDIKAIGQGIVYVKPVMVTDLPSDVRDQVGDLEQLFAVHDAEGQQLALVASRMLAFDLARENKMQPVALH